MVVRRGVNAELGFPMGHEKKGVSTDPPQVRKATPEHEKAPLASHAIEDLAKDFLPIHLSPGEYAARYGDGWGFVSYRAYRYRDPRLDAWIAAVNEIVSSPTLLARVRDRVKGKD